MNRCIIITADDFGLCAGVNKAVALAHTKGVLTSAILMANMPNAEEAVSIAKKLPSLGVGLWSLSPALSHETYYGGNDIYAPCPV
jgi:predicted glycoside hydrolase/deacetylase ChbG (UPF0249 family)